MSQAFVRDSDDMWLSDVSPTVHALTVFLTRENNGIDVYQLKTTVEQGIEIFWMSNGLRYWKNHRNEWEVVEDKA
ncbi:MAG TPA: hypothetical protein VD927_18860 [Chryseosolibacter sp.]|nr:hypothetical protein [Chryseosolibacter sp.]